MATSSSSAPAARGPAGGMNEKAPVDAEMIALARSTGDKGLTANEAAASFERWGPNELGEKKVNPILQFLSFLWGPMPIMIWVAILVEIAKAAVTGGEGIEDIVVLTILQFANAIIGFIEEKNAGDAIAALKAKLAPVAHVCRDGTWRHLPARELVPGDLIELVIGNIVPADAVLRDCKPCQIDQAALTGESLPVTKSSWEKLLMGSVVKQGEATAVVVATGANTFFGEAAKLISSVTHVGRLQRTLFKITAALLLLSIVFCSIIFAVLYPVLERINPLAVVESADPVVGALSVVIVILVASIPVAIEVVCTSTMAVGSHSLSERGVIVSRLSAIEELAGMSVLCSDKTGTLTKNKLELQTPIVLANTAPCEIVLYAALASKRSVGNQDAIDFAICDFASNIGLLEEALTVRGQRLEDFVEVDFVPFNPTDKRTTARVRQPDGSEIEVMKGSPIVILNLVHNKAAINDTVVGYVQALADRGFRALGVALNLNHPDDPVKKWEYLGILSIYDPPRIDTKATIAAAIENQIAVKMVTGDHGAIARETCRVLGMGDKIFTTAELDNADLSEKEIDGIIMSSDGFAEVMPEHKFRIVERIRAQGHVTGMTGDGVNDAPALKRADVGIAVAGATDAARAAADLVLTREGLGVIIEAIFESRCIFQRMRNYIIYRIACTVQLLLFFFLAILTIDVDSAFYYSGQYCAAGYTPGLPLYNATSDSLYVDADPMPGVVKPFFFANGCDKDTVSDIVPSGSASPLVSAALSRLVVASRSADNPLAHAPAFTLPVISLVLITILNDGCMITISQDFVVPEKKPQSWRLFEATVVALVIGVVALASSLFLVVGIMHNNILHADEVARFMASNGRNFITWFELRAIMYLKVSVSDFLTLFSARTRGWFFERRLSNLLGAAAGCAILSSTLFALYWDTICKKDEDELTAAGTTPKLGPSAYMSGLRHSEGAALCTFLYCIFWFFLQDAAKVGTYWFLERWEARGFRWADQLPLLGLHAGQQKDGAPRASAAAPRELDAKGVQAAPNPLNVLRAE